MNTPIVSDKEQELMIQKRDAQNFRATEFEDDSCMYDKLWLEEVSGLSFALMVGVTQDSVECVPLDYLLVSKSDDSAKRMMRGHREIRKCLGDTIAPIAESALREELVILPGVAMSTTDVISALRKVITKLEKDGMFIGYDNMYPIIETADGALLHLKSPNCLDSTTSSQYFELPDFSVGEQCHR